MGHEATVTKKRVLGKVEQCVVATNYAVSGVEELRKIHNAFTQKAGEEFVARDKRLSGQGAMIEAIEHAVRREDERSLAADRELNDRTKILEELAPNLAETVGRLQTRVLRAEADILTYIFAFTSMTFLQRLRYLFTGRWPSPVNETMDGIARVSAQGRRVCRCGAEVMPPRRRLCDACVASEDAKRTMTYDGVTPFPISTPPGPYL